MQVKDVMTSDVACCTPGTSIRDAAQLMNEHDCGIIPVLVGDNDRHIKGVITDRDIASRAVAQGLDPRECAVDECMSKNVYTARPEESVEDCSRVMREHQVRRLPVVDEDGICCGVVAQADLALDASDQAAGLVKGVSEPTAEARR